jgi:hypothetical protein
MTRGAGAVGATTSEMLRNRKVLRRSHRRWHHPEQSEVCELVGVKRAAFVSQVDLIESNWSATTS